MKLFTNHVPFIGLACVLVLPMSGHAQDWQVDLTGNYEIRNSSVIGNPVPFTIENQTPADIFYISNFV